MCACGGAGRSSRGADGRAWFVVVVSCRVGRVGGLGAVFVEVRFGRRGIPGNVLLSEIYVLACSEPPLQRVSPEKSAQGYPEIGTSSLYPGQGILLLKNEKITDLPRLSIKARPDLRGIFRN